MKPMGTITKYYPFIDEESKTILDSLMEGASNYYDFVQQLCEVALNNDVPVNLAYLATMQAWFCRMSDAVKQLGERYGEILFIRPWLHIIDSGQKVQALYHDTVIAAIDRAIETSVDNWIEVNLHILHAFFHHPFGEVISLYEPLEKVKAMINSNPHLRCFESIIYAFEGIARARDGEIMEALEVLQKGKALAESYNDEFYMYINMLQEGIIQICHNVDDAAAIFEDLYELVQKFQVPGFVTEILNDSSLVYETLGEFDLVISSIQEIMKIVGEDNLVDTNFVFLSRTNATLGNGQLALEWINRGIEDSGQFESEHQLLYRAWALALVNRLDEAEKTLETGYSLLIKTGLERHLGDYYHISGVIEFRRGNYLSALALVEKAWEIADTIPTGSNKNRALLELARIENSIVTQSKDDTKSAAPGKWLSTLEKYACNRDLPGIRMYAGILKSEFYQNNGQLKDAIATLQDALTITDSLGVQTLRRKITKQIQNLEQLLQQEGSIS